MASLRTHLLYEAVDIAFAKTEVHFRDKRDLDPNKRRFWQLTEPQHACALAISSPHCYKLVAYMLQRHATCVNVKDTVIQCGTRCYHYTISVISFSSHYYIRRFIELAGRFCSRLEKFSYTLKSAYHSIFVDSLVDNNVCDSYGSELTYPVRHCTIFLSDVTNPQPQEPEPIWIKSSMKFVRQDGVVQFLGINGIERPVDQDAFTFLKDMKIETLHILSSLMRSVFYETDKTISFDIFYRHRPNMEYMKTFRCDYQINIQSVVMMLKRYKIQNVRINNVRLPDYNQNPNKLRRVRCAIANLWTHMQQYDGNVYVDCKSYQSIRTDWEAVVENVKAELPEYHVSQKDVNDVIITMERASGTKKLLVEIVFYNYARYRCRAPYQLRRRHEHLEFRPY
uniref:HORMA domain-containing protein n=1 Tax=Panagrellus redivivus TaxID=6233 RepID=A0A7E4WDP1_PANRE